MPNHNKYERNLLFIDIETVSAVPDFDLLNNQWQQLWLRKAQYLRNDDFLTDAEFYMKRAGIYAEFGKIIAIGMGFFYWEDDQRCLKVKTIANHSEDELLLEFKQVIEKKYRPSDLVLCAHNGKEFDYPYLCRRMLVNKITLPQALQLSSKKPWEINHIDTLEMWKFGDKKHYTSLELLATLFNIPAKTEMSGEQVNATYHLEKDLEKIKRYCSEDIIVLAQLFLTYQAEALIPDNCIDRI